jgi:hypothetical protein
LNLKLLSIIIKKKITHLFILIKYILLLQLIFIIIIRYEIQIVEKNLLESTKIVRTINCKPIEKGFVKVKIMNNNLSN